MWNISVKRGFVATNVLKVTYGLIHNHMCTGCVITETVKTVFVKLSMLTLEFVFQVIGLQRSAPLRVGEVNASPASADNTGMQLITLAPAGNAKAAKVQNSDLYPTKSDSPVCFAVVECQSSALFFSLSTTPENDVMVSPCDRTQNTVCRCQDGYYKHIIDSEEYACYRCKPCELNEKEIQRCEPNNEP